MALARTRRWLVISICVLMVYFYWKTLSNGYLTSSIGSPHRLSIYESKMETDLFSSPHPPAQLGSYTCRNSICSEYLGVSDLQNYKSVMIESIAYVLEEQNVLLPPNNGGGGGIVDISSINKEGKCHFMNGTGRSAVALVSYPGSGNTWLRGLLEQVTGICTGSIYKDPVLRNSGFLGESIRTGTVLAVKVHGVHLSLQEPKEEKDLKYGSGIFLVRNPFHATVSNWQRVLSGHNHVGVIGQEYFGNHSDWNEYVNNMSNRWKNVLLKSIAMSNKLKRPIHIMRYEDLRADTFGEMERILKFLNVTFQTEHVKTKLKYDFTTFKRKQSKYEFEHYTKSQKLLIKELIASTVSRLKHINDRRTFDIEQYLEY